MHVQACPKLNHVVLVYKLFFIILSIIKKTYITLINVITAAECAKYKNGCVGGLHNNFILFNLEGLSTKLRIVETLLNFHKLFN